MSKPNEKGPQQVEMAELNNVNQNQETEPKITVNLKPGDYTNI